MSWQNLPKSEREAVLAPLRLTAAHARYGVEHVKEDVDKYAELTDAQLAVLGRSRAYIRGMVCAAYRVNAEELHKVRGLESLLRFVDKANGTVA